MEGNQNEQEEEGDPGAGFQTKRGAESTARLKIATA